MPSEEIDLGIDGITGAVEVGRGGFAAVYRATQPDFHRDVAVKIIILPSLDEAARSRFRRECRAIGSLSGHPNIVAVHQSGFTATGLPYLIMDYLAQGSLEDSLVRDGPRPWEEAAEIGVKIARTLAFAHGHNLLHRDVKPANILVSKFGEPQLADFGIAWAIDGSGRSASALTTGTPAYAPPETWTDAAPTVARDIYSLGATIHALITGDPPFMAESQGNILRVIMQVNEEAPRDLRPLGVPNQVCAAIEWAMAKNPADRPPSADAFAEAIEAALAKRIGATASQALPIVGPEPPEPPGPRESAASQPEPAARSGAEVSADPDHRHVETLVEAGAGPGPTEPVPGRRDAPPATGTSQGGLAAAGPSGGRASGASPPRRRRWIAIPVAVALAALVVAVVVLRPGKKKLPEGPAALRSPAGVAIDSSGNVYVADNDNGRVVKVNPRGGFTTVAGSHGGGGDGGPATAVTLSNPQAVAVDPAGDVFIAEGGVIRKVNPGGVISTVPVHVPGGSNPNSISAQSIVVDPKGRLVVDSGTDVVRIDQNGTVEELAGTGQAGFGGDGKPAVAAKLNNPLGLAFGPDGDLYIADSNNNRVRKIGADGTIDTVAGPGGANAGDGGPAVEANLSAPVGIGFDAHGNLYIAEKGASRIRRVDAVTGIIETIAGSSDGTTGFAGDGGPARTALFSGLLGLAVAPSGDIYVTDGDNNRVRRITTNLIVTTVA